MKRILFCVLGMFLLTGVCSAAGDSEFKTDNDKLNYSLGYQIGGNFKVQGIELNNIQLFEKGVQDGYAGAEPALREEEIIAALKELQMKMQAVEEAEYMEAATKNLAEGELFLSENAKKDGVKTLPSGLQYKVVKEGSGTTPKAESIVTVNYRGSLIDGTEFDSSYRRGEPATFRVNGVIKGWTEALQLMKTGSQWKLFIPAKLAYGENGAGPIPPNSVLIFDVELISAQ